MLVGMSFLNRTHAEILARLTAVVSEAAGAPLVVRVGEEAYGARNVGVDLPRSRTKAEGAALRLRVREALEKARVVMAPHGLAPRVDGTLRGQVRVKEARVSMVGDAAHRARGPLPGEG
jgi:hypothetical protein